MLEDAFPTLILRPETELLQLHPSQVPDWCHGRSLEIYTGQLCPLPFPPSLTFFFFEDHFGVDIQVHGHLKLLGRRPEHHCHHCDKLISLAFIVLFGSVTVGLYDKIGA